MKKVAFLLALSLICGILSACAAPAAVPIEENPAAPAVTPEPTATATRKPSSTPKPTKTSLPPTDTPGSSYEKNDPPALRTMLPGSDGEVSASMLDRQKVEEGGFSFQPPAGYLFDIEGSQVNIFNLDASVTFTIAGMDYIFEGESAQELTEGYLGMLFSEAHGKLGLSDPDPLVVDGVKGTLRAIEGKMYNSVVKGQMALFVDDPEHIVFSYGFADTKNKVEMNPWEAEGWMVFEETMKSIKFFPPQKVKSGGKCLTAQDPTYGLIPEHPIKVGGETAEGFAREQKYLQNLLGPGGETTHFFRWGTLKVNGTDLDIYELSYAGIRTLVFLDSMHWGTPYAPNGFTCKGKFTLKAPWD